MPKLSLSEMAKVLGVSTKTFSRDLAKKNIPYITVGSRKRFDSTEVLEAYTRPQRTAQTSRKRTTTITRGRFAERLGI